MRFFTEQINKLTRIMLHQRNRRIHSGLEFFGSFDEP